MRRRDLILWPAAVGAAAAAAIAVLKTNPLGVLKPCPLKLLTGVPCPTCGGTEALRSLARGDLTHAFAVQPLIALLGVALLVSAVVALLLLPWADRLRVPRAARPWLWGFLAAVAANWIYLMIRSR